MNFIFSPIDPEGIVGFSLLIVMRIIFQIHQVVDLSIKKPYIVKVNLGWSQLWQNKMTKKTKILEGEIS
ncbi:MAG: hypothetical protein DRP89_04310 [Candidatus Neomarinimicrobiota bacterium]|nr:MAG: hypothetical protein DRP89_04310 [Candidatus Neomarinimicrobiota bacterium]